MNSGSWGGVVCQAGVLCARDLPWIGFGPGQPELLHKYWHQSGSIVVLAADSTLYSRDDRLSTTLKEGLVLDFRDWEDANTYEAALAALVRTLSREGP